MNDYQLVARKKANRTRRYPAALNDNLHVPVIGAREHIRRRPVDQLLCQLLRAGVVEDNFDARVAGRKLRSQGVKGVHQRGRRKHDQGRFRAGAWGRNDPTAGGEKPQTKGDQG